MSPPPRDSLILDSRRQVRALNEGSWVTSWLAMGQQDPALEAVAENDSLRRLQVCVCVCVFEGGGREGGGAGVGVSVG
jgi:hypothetical protein